MQDHCETLEAAFIRSYVCGTFKSLQCSFFVSRRDIQSAVDRCRETKVEIHLTDFLKVNENARFMILQVGKVMQKIYLFIYSTFSDCM